MQQEQLALKEKLDPKQLPLQAKIAFYLEDTETTWGFWSNICILSLIFLSSTIFVAETYSINPQLQTGLEIINLVILIIFSFEYILRLWSAENPRKFFFSFFSLIDLVAILPLLLGWMDIRFIRVFRWFRILRIVRFWRVEKQLLGIKTEDTIVIIRIFLTLFTLIFVYAGLIYQVEHQVNSDRLNNFFDAFYFVVVTMTTVGYGDVTPLSQPGRVMTVLMIFTGVMFIPWQLSELIGQVVKTSSLVEQKCTNCGLYRHDPDALFCKHCGVKLEAKNREKVPNSVS
ncbi:ion transporter [Pleurocapsa sp. PCC 7319]|uniref:ion transporter n=1 Tax=Pleurocapsa sp. PCC 7319 TaxID=118161 RepID=UPI0003480F42|nr:ion transporter [Pleurocapsa sp. PCC 7319]